ncbi:MAG: inositol monophosphatase family protein [Candidatus Thorarchaeota archaeon]
MTALKTIHTAISAAKRCILENLEQSSEQTGSVNPYGDKTLLLDMMAEEEILSILQSSSIDFAILTEEKGFVESDQTPEYLAIVDPIDGSANIERGIPLVTIGISIVPYKDKMTTDDVEISVIDSVFTEETYVAITGKGVSRNNKSVKVRPPVELEKAIVSYDTKKTWDSVYMDRSLKAIKSLHDIRRTASNLLDLCWTAAGFLDGLVDLRDMLPIIHLSGTHMVFEAGGYVLDIDGTRYCSPLKPDLMMNIVAASNETLARQILAIFQS